MFLSDVHIIVFVRIEKRVLCMEPSGLKKKIYFSFDNFPAAQKKQF